jgi:hypothetical protein
MSSAGGWSRSAPSSDALDAEFNRLAGQVYTGLRDGTLDPEATFDLACFLLEWAPPDAVVRELAEQSAWGDDPARLAELARQTLEAAEFGPGFALEPRLLARLEQALQIVSADLRATGLTGPARLVLNDGGEPSHAFVEFGGTFGPGNGITPGNGGNLRDALLSVADDLQDAVMDSLSTVWPVCPSHQRGAHPRETSGEPVWWCSGGVAGHVIAGIGRWPRA